MEHSFYNDSLYNYLVIPAEGTENYQYRMLAVNRISGLLPCNIRTIDGKAYLYYDITSKQSLDEICVRPLRAEMVRKLLYAIVNAGRTLSDYLLDDNRLLLCSEYIFYDYETEDFLFMYYPDEAEGTSAKDLFEYLSVHIDPSEKRTAYILYRLCELSSMKNFILKKEFLEKEYENDRHDLGNDRYDFESDRGKEASDNDEPYVNDVLSKSTYIKTEPEEDKTTDIGCEKKDRKPSSGRRENRLVRILGAAIIFLILAVAAEWIGTNFDMTDEYRRILLILVVVFLSLAILTALIGTILTFFNGRKELREEEKRIEKQKKNEMADTIEYQTEESF